MHYIFNSEEKLIGWCDFEPCQEDLNKRGEFSISSDNVFENPINVIVGKYKTLLEPTQVVTKEDLTNKLLENRDRALISTDWVSVRHFEQKTFGVDTTLSDSEFKEYLIYRQSLRDITKLEDFPNVVLPDKPKFME